MNKKSVLVIFGNQLPPKNREWFKSFDIVVGPLDLKDRIQKKQIEFIDIQKFISVGSVQEAYAFAKNLSQLPDYSGQPLPKLINYRGYELWWMHYDDLYYKFCLPFTQYRDLLFYLKQFGKVCLFEPPRHHLFRYFLSAYGCRHFILSRFSFKDILPVSPGILIQNLLSLIFLVTLVIKRPKLMVWVSDKFAPPHKCDFRMIYIYQELRQRKINFVEFIRSIESWPVVLSHAWQRKRPVFYSTAVINLVSSFGNLFNKKYRQLAEKVIKNKDPEKRFWLKIATHYLPAVQGDIFSIKAMEIIYRLIGVRTSYIAAVCNRTVREFLGCKLAGIKTVGIQHGAAPRYYFISDFMPGFNGAKMFSPDRYGLWSNWWKEYYIKNSNAFKEEQLYVSGPMRPLRGTTPSVSDLQKSSRLKLLFISEQLAAPEEIIPYLTTILSTKDFELYFKFRPYRDGFEFWLKKNQPAVYAKILASAKIFRGTMEDAISHCDIVVGSHSTAVLEGLLQLKPIVFFYTQKWGDYFDIKDWDVQGRFCASNPEELVEKIRASVNVPKEDLRKLQEQFFGNPYRDGGKWVVDQVEKLSDTY